MMEQGCRLLGTARMFGYTIIDHIRMLCDFPADSIMVCYMEQKGWKKLSDITLIPLDEIKDFALTKDDGSVIARPMAKHLRMFKGFLLYYQRQC